MTVAASKGTAGSVSRLAAVLRDPRTAVPDRAAAQEIVDAAERHRMFALLGRRLSNAGTLPQWPRNVRDRLAAVERESAAVECIRSRELEQVLEALWGAGVRALIFKGAALAYTHYPAPHLRSRTDTDILLEAAAAPTGGRVLESLGYLPQHETSGALVSHQRHFGKHDHFGIFHAVDLHWKISNRHALADRIGFDELWRRSVPLPALGSTAVTVDPIHALLLAVVHRAGHHPGSSNLLWLYDMYVLLDLLCEPLRRGIDRSSIRGASLDVFIHGRVDRLQ